MVSIPALHVALDKGNPTGAMMENNLIMLLEHKWSLLRHIETERHWILTAYAVIVAGVLNQTVASSDASTARAMSYLLLFILGVIGALHSYRAAWVLRDVQSDVNEIVQMWRDNSSSESDWLKIYWSFSKRPKERYGRIKWFFSQYCVWMPTFSVTYALAYTVAIFVFLGLSVWFFFQ